MKLVSNTKSLDGSVKRKTASSGSDLREFDSDDLKWDPESIYFNKQVILGLVI